MGDPDVFLFGLAPRGVCLAGDVTTSAGELLPHHFTLDPFGQEYFLLHLSSDVIRPDVIRLAALRCSDFPPLLPERRLPNVARMRLLDIIMRGWEATIRAFARYGLFVFIVWSIRSMGKISPHFSR